MWIYSLLTIIFEISSVATECVDNYQRYVTPQISHHESKILCGHLCNLCVLPAGRCGLDKLWTSLAPLRKP